jgi:CRP/FNR family transcriptional regulator
MLILEKIKSLKFFKNLDDNQLNRLVKISSIDTHNENYVLYYENESLDKIFFLISGLAKSYKIDKNDNEIFLYYIQQDTILSEISSLNTDTLSTYSNISFIEDSEVLSIDYKLFKKYFLDTNISLNNFTTEIINRSKMLESLINREFIIDAVGKVSMMIATI